jgi:hypothetical protein
MAPVSRPASARLVGLQYLAVTSVGWGLDGPAMKYLLTERPPLFSRGLALVVAGLAFTLRER